MIFGIRKSIFRRLLFSFIFTVLLGLCAVGLMIALMTQSFITNTKKDELLRQAKKVNLALQQVGPMNQAGIREALMFFDQSYDARVLLFDANGGIVLSAPVKGMQEMIRSVRETVLWATLLGLTISVVIASFLSWSISRPLQTIDRTAARIGMGGYGERIRISSKDEIGELAVTINRMAEKLEQIDREKKRSEQIRMDVLANVSHELRTPLTAMQGFLEALQDGLIDEERRQRYYDILYNETLHMNRLVDDLMDLIKLENQEVGLVRVPLKIGPILHNAAFKFGPEAEEKGTSIEVEVENELPKVNADYDRIEQILNNLVKNAVKFTERGRIVLRACREEAFVRISVEDTGRGIPESERELIWERFFKVDQGRSYGRGPSRSGQHKGTGLGLAIVKELVKLHDGNITVDSVVDEGTTFTIRLPAA
ncbi:sensor histidine kinase [Paenibacillus chartarius]|uniref:histidine kinase n=1 Tax=Paenibacillus chartarius TaxID=747481 RepID=A0ABV6DN72_9BACL